MCLFSFIADKGREMQEEILQAQMRAEEWDNWDIMRAIKRTSKKTEIMGFVQALKNRAKTMSNSELERLYDEAYEGQNIRVITMLGPIWEEHGVAYKDENGFYRKKR